jgi:hypothetical protein
MKDSKHKHIFKKVDKRKKHILKTKKASIYKRKLKRLLTTNLHQLQQEKLEKTEEENAKP